MVQSFQVVRHDYACDLWNRTGGDVVLNSRARGGLVLGIFQEPNYSATGHRL
jgi:hypothetical protein